MTDLKTPKTLKETAEDVKDAVVEGAAEGVEAVRADAETVAGKLTELRETAVKQFNDATENVKKAVVERTEPLMDALSEATEGIQTGVDGFVEHQKKAVTELGKALEALIPSAVREHGQSAVTEFVEGYRKLFDGVIDNAIALLQRAKVGEGEAEAPAVEEAPAATAAKKTTKKAAE